MFLQNNQKQWIFSFDKESPEKAGEVASNCSYFQVDDEDEQVSDILQSCYNCRYRRWTMESFICKKLPV